MAFSFTSGMSHDVMRFFKQYKFEERRGLKEPWDEDKGVLIASAYGARVQRWWKPTPALKDTIRKLLSGVQDAEEERLTLEAVLGLMEMEFSTELKMSDRASLDWMGGGDSTQMDCVDEAWNATACLKYINECIIALKHHLILEPISKQPLFKWNHYGAVIEAIDAGQQRYVIDGGVRRGGEPPKIYKLEDWYN